jgi:exosortase/archaeosortase
VRPLTGILDHQEKLPMKGETGSLVGTKLGLSGDQVEVLRACVVETSIFGLMGIAGRVNCTRLGPLMQAGLIVVSVRYSLMYAEMDGKRS